MSLRLPSKVPFAIIGDEKCSDGSVRIVRAKVTLTPVKAAELAIWPPRFKNWPTHRRVSQFLRQPQILGLADVAELGAVLGVVLIQLRPATESGAAGEKQECDQQKADYEPGRTCLHLTIKPHWQRCGLALK
jgi:hypothetical protein